MPLTGRLSVRGAMFGHLLVLRVEEKESQVTAWRDATFDDLAELGTLDFAAKESSTIPITRKAAL